jgi:hypothetical protein
MKSVSDSQTVQAILKMDFSIGLVQTGFGVMGGGLGNAVSFLLAGILATSAPYVLRLSGPDYGGRKATPGGLSTNRLRHLAPRALTP